MATDEAVNLAGETTAPAGASQTQAAEPPAEPLREEQIANAVAFLTNPKVSSASAEAKTTFLVKKGLTSAEIDEAYRRAPSIPASISFAPPAAQAPTAQTPPFAPPSAPGQQQVYGQQPLYQPQRTGQLVAQPYRAAIQQQLQQQQLQQQQQRPSWSAIVLALGALAAGGYGLQRLLTPYAREYYQRWQTRSAAGRTEASGQPAAATADSSSSGGVLTPAERSTAATLATAIKSQTEELQSTMKELKQLVEAFRKEATRGRHAAPMEAEADQGGATPQSMEVFRKELRDDVRKDLRAELCTFAQTISELTGGDGAETPASSHYSTPGRVTPTRATSPGAASAPSGSASRFSNGRMNSHGSSGGTKVIPNGRPASSQAGAADELRDIHQMPGTKSGGSSVAGEALNGGAPRKTPAMADVMAMMQAGVTPSNVRSNIVDAPPDSSAAPSSSRLTPPPKPWERSPGYSSGGGGPPSWGSHLTHTPHPLSTASSVSDAVGNGWGHEASEAPWKPPAVPQPSITLPRHRALSPTPPSQRALSTAGSEVSQAAKARPAGETAREKALFKDAPPQPQQSGSSPIFATSQQHAQKDMQQHAQKDAPPAFAAPQVSDSEGSDDRAAAWDQQPASVPEQVLQGGQKKQSGGLHADAPEFKPRPSGSIGSAHGDSQ